MKIQLSNKQRHQGLIEDLPLPMISKKMHIYLTK